MLNESLESDQEVDPERERQKLMLKRQKSIEESLQLNVKDHIVKLENYLAELKKDLEISKKEMSNLRMEIGTVKNNHGKSSDDLCTFIQNDAKRLLNEALKKSQDVKHDTEFLDAQLNVLKSDKEKLQEVTNIVTSQIYIKNSIQILFEVKICRMNNICFQNGKNDLLSNLSYQLIFLDKQYIRKENNIL